MLAVFSFIRCLRRQSTLLFSIAVDDLIIPATPHISQETEPELRNANLWQCFKQWRVALTEISSISTDHYPWRSSPRSLSGEHFREPLSLNCWGLAGPKSLCAHTSNSILRITFTQHLFLAESHFLPPEPLLHSSALAHALRLVLCCLVWFSEALIYPKILQPSVSVEEQGSVLWQIYLDHGILAQQ